MLGLALVLALGLKRTASLPATRGPGGPAAGEPEVRRRGERHRQRHGRQWRGSAIADRAGMARRGAPPQRCSPHRVDRRRRDDDRGRSPLRAAVGARRRGALVSAGARRRLGARDQAEGGRALRGRHAGRRGRGARHPLSGDGRPCRTRRAVKVSSRGSPSPRGSWSFGRSDTRSGSKPVITGRSAAPSGPLSPVQPAPERATVSVKHAPAHVRPRMRPRRRASRAESVSPSTLATENDLFSSALKAGSAGDRREAVELLDVLLARFPQSPLRQSAESARAKLSESIQPAR